MTPMRLYAPAKVNWTLEVLGRRDDSYHEVRTVMQTIDLCDELQFWAETRPDAPRPVVRGEEPTLVLKPGNLLLGWSLDYLPPGDEIPPIGNLVDRAAHLLDPDWNRLARVDVTKRIPVAAGLGGGSSDAAAALRALNDVWGLHHDGAALTELAAQIGSDVPFFLHGGTALAEGRGERVTPLPDAAAVWLVLLVPPLQLPDKTRRMYAALAEADFSDGSRTAALVERVRKGEGVREEDLYVAFERAAYEVFEGLGDYRDALLAAGAGGVHLAGAGPALFALGPDEAGARAIRDKVSLPDARVLVVRTLTAAESLRREG